MTSALALAACGHSPTSGLTKMVDSPIIQFKAPDKDRIAEITKIDEDDEAPAPTPAPTPAPAPEKK